MRLDPRSPQSASSIVGRLRLLPALPILVTLAAAGFAACGSDPAPGESNTDSGTLDTDRMEPPIDSGMPDSAMPDGAIDDSVADAEPETAPLTFSDKLSEMTLYSDFAAKTVAPINKEFEPTFELWADGLKKQRWIALPKGTKIDDSDMDHWVFPVGTRFWKEFSKDGKRLETRLLWQQAAGDWVMGTYLWNDTESEATFTKMVGMNLRGSGWDSPSETMCQRCHEGEPGRILGFAAMQLAKAPGSVTLAGLDTAGLLKMPLAKSKSYGVPGTDAEAAALGYLHANCGHCHNPNNTATTAIVDQVLRLYVDERDVPTTTLYNSTVNQKTKLYGFQPFRIRGGDALHSAVYERQTLRGSSRQMPPIATKIVNSVGLAPVKTWIDSLPLPPDGGPADAAADVSTDAKADGG